MAEDDIENSFRPQVELENERWSPSFGKSVHNVTLAGAWMEMEKLDSVRVRER